MDSFTLNKIEFDAVRDVLASYCATAIGKSVAARISPSRDPRVINHWLGQVSEMVLAVRDFGLPPFGGLSDLAGPLERAIPGGGASPEDFAAMAAGLEALGALRNWSAALPEQHAALHQLAAGIGEFAGELDAIRSIVGADGAVASSASEKLATIRRDIETTAGSIHDVIHRYLRQPEVTKLLQNASATLHGDRYVLPVKVEYRGRLEGVVHRSSHTGQTIFVEPMASVELNNKLADLYDDERLEIQRLLNQLCLRIMPRSAEIRDALRTAAHLDVLAAKAQYAYQNAMTCPTVTDRGPLQFTQARHPLLVQRQAEEERRGVPADRRHAVVPIDVRLGLDFDLLVITGSNTGGKTVTLKTVALLAVMAQSGMHIPAQRGAVMPAFRDVFIDIGDEQSLQQSLSTFGAHIKRLKFILGKADSGSLVLLDELGSGTDPDEGGAIGQAILDELRRMGCMGMVTTHLSVLKAYALNHERVDNASVEFDTEKLAPTYHLQIGTPGESHAITVAAKLGMPRRLVAAARQHLNSQGRQFRKAIHATGQARQVAEEARTQANAAQLAAVEQQEAYESKLADLHRLQEEFNTWLARLPELRPGEEVHVPSLKRTGRLARLEFHRQIALVDIDAMQVEVPLAELMPDLGQKEVREQIAALRHQIIEQAKAAQATAEQAQRVRDEYQQSVHQQRERARQFDTWLSAIGRVKVGDEVPIAVRPGKGVLVAVDLHGLRARVKTDEGEQEISIQDIFPQTGPFAPRAPNRHDPRHARRQQAYKGDAQTRRRGDAETQQRPQQGPQRQGHSQQQRSVPPPQRGPGGPPARQEEPPEPNRPVTRRDPKASAARSVHEALLATPPGAKVYVIPFGKKATLIRLNAEKDLAVVQSGAFEMELPLADLEPVREPPPPVKPKAAKRPPGDKPKPEPADQPPAAPTPPE